VQKSLLLHSVPSSPLGRGRGWVGGAGVGADARVEANPPLIPPVFASLTNDFVLWGGRLLLHSRCQNIFYNVGVLCQISFDNYYLRQKPVFSEKTGFYNLS
jgi:hypothetical protein